VAEPEPAVAVKGKVVWKYPTLSPTFVNGNLRGQNRDTRRLSAKGCGFQAALVAEDITWGDTPESVSREAMAPGIAVPVNLVLSNLQDGDESLTFLFDWANRLS
jgi:hypothetical protein